MSDKELQLLSRSLTNLIFRSSIVEDFHSNNATLTDAVMCELNKDINNRIYTILNLYYSDNPKDKLILNGLVSFYSNYGVEWDPAQMCVLSEL